MSDSGVTLIANLEIHDPDRYRRYERGFFPILKRHGGTFVTFDDSAETLEGDAPIGGRIVLFRFPSEQAAREWYEDPEYQALSKHRRGSTSARFLVMVHDPPAQL